MNMFLIDKIKATWNFWNNYGNGEISKDLPFDGIPNYVSDLDDIEQDGTEIVSKDISVIHAMRVNSTVSINIPGHEPRVNSNLFNQTRKHIIEDLKTPCRICGSFDNLQLHHFWIEHSLSNCIDWSKVKSAHPDFPDWNKIDEKNPDTFVFFIDSPYNANMVLCQKHHTGTGKIDKKYGIHYINFPFFIAQAYVKDDYKLFDI